MSKHQVKQTNQQKAPEGTHASWDDPAWDNGWGWNCDTTKDVSKDLIESTQDFSSFFSNLPNKKSVCIVELFSQNWGRCRAVLAMMPWMKRQFQECCQGELHFISARVEAMPTFSKFLGLSRPTFVLYWGLEPYVLVYGPSTSLILALVLFIGKSPPAEEVDEFVTKCQMQYGEVVQLWRRFASNKFGINKALTVLRATNMAAASEDDSWVYSQPTDKLAVSQPITSLKDSEGGQQWSSLLSSLPVDEKTKGDAQAYNPPAALRLSSVASGNKLSTAVKPSQQSTNPKLAVLQNDKFSGSFSGKRSRPVFSISAEEGGGPGTTATEIASLPEAPEAPAFAAALSLKSESRTASTKAAATSAATTPTATAAAPTPATETATSTTDTNTEKATPDAAADAPAKEEEQAGLLGRRRQRRASLQRITVSGAAGALLEQGVPSPSEANERQSDNEARFSPLVNKFASKTDVAT